MLLTAVDIRLASPADASLIADLSRSTFYDTFAPFNSKENMDKFMKEQFSHQSLMAEVEQPGNTFLLAHCVDEPAGYVRLRDNNNPPELIGLQTIEIARIYVIQKMIGKGVGKTLMEEAIAIARRKQKQYIWLGVWEKNYTAIDFYRAWGFKKVGQQPFALGDDMQTDWLMIKQLEEDSCK
jgi:ribosomal protein S18 acetylase RimI-like enzyme